MDEVVEETTQGETEAGTNAVETIKKKRLQVEEGEDGQRYVEVGDGHMVEVPDGNGRVIASITPARGSHCPGDARESARPTSRKRLYDHGERQFIEWFRTRNPKWLARVNSIDVKVFRAGHLCRMRCGH